MHLDSTQNTNCTNRTTEYYLCFLFAMQNVGFAAVSYSSCILMQQKKALQLSQPAMLCRFIKETIIRTKLRGSCIQMLSSLIKNCFYLLTIKSGLAMWLPLKSSFKKCTHIITSINESRQHLLFLLSSFPKKR